jgi:hypothetical protein
LCERAQALLQIAPKYFDMHDCSSHLAAAPKCKVLSVRVRVRVACARARVRICAYLRKCLCVCMD